MKKIFVGLFGVAFCLSVLFLVGCGSEAGLTLVPDDTEQTVSSGMYKVGYPLLKDKNGNLVLSYEISVLSIVREDGAQIEASGNLVDFTAQGKYVVTFGVKDLPKVKPVEKIYVVIDETPPEVRSFDYPEAVVVGRKYSVPAAELYDASGVNEQKTEISVIDKYNNPIKIEGRGFTADKAGEYRFRVKTEDNNGVSKTYYFPFVAYEVNRPVDKKVCYFDEDFGLKQIATGLKRGESNESYTLYYTTKKAFGSEKGSTVITVNEATEDVCLRLISPYIKDVSDYSRLVYRIYVETADKPYTSVLAGAYRNYRDLSVNKWEEMIVSVKALKEGGSVVNGLTDESIVSTDITDLTIRLFRWSNPLYGGVEDKEGFPAGTKIYISAMEARENDPSVIYEFTSDEGDHGAKAINIATGKPVNSYGGNVAHGSFVGLGDAMDTVRFYLQNETQTDDEYFVYLPVLDVKNYGSVTVSIKTNNCKKMGISAEECIDFGNPTSMTVTFVYNEQTDDMTVTFESGSKKLSVTVGDADIINGYSQFAIYALGTTYTEIYIAPIRKS